ncbi:MAG: DEAD/DEAH box helicase [Candidatus Thermoplasmatota archaeon]|nr:DEAD/DEAH box helicase [Candidatus Thermoplasmatota archaeon]
MRFEELNLNPCLLTQVSRMGYKETTPIQSRAIPVIMQGKDVLGQAQTGTGKTAAFVLPVLNRLMKMRRGEIRTLILAPTRELVEQIHVATGELGKLTGVQSMTVYGGVGMRPQVERLRRRPDIVVACPGRLLDHMRNRTVDLSKVDTLILDEADRMLDMGFLPDIKKIIERLPAKRQTLLFSATIPIEIKHLAYEFMNEPESVDIGHNAPVETVLHAIYPVPAHLKTDLLVELLRKTDTRSVLVFTRTKHRAMRVGRQLKDAGFSSVSLQGNMSQNKRDEAIKGFRSGKYQILVATDIAARGIDVSTISHVINLDIPDTADAYTHRIGRTGRVDRTGDAFTIVSDEDEPMIRTIERLIGSGLERRTLEGFDYGPEPVGRRTLGGRQSRSRGYPGPGRPLRPDRDPFRPPTQPETLFRSMHRS